MRAEVDLASLRHSSCSFLFIFKCPLTDELQAASGADGTVTVWDVSGTEPKVEKHIDGIIPAVVDAE